LQPTAVRTTELDELRPSQTKILASMVAAQRESARGLRATSFKVDSLLVKTNWARRISLTWFDATSRRMMRKVSYQLVTRVYGTSEPSAEVTVSLIAPEAEFQARLPLFNQVLESFKWLRD